MHSWPEPTIDFQGRDRDVKDMPKRRNVQSGSKPAPVSDPGRKHLTESEAADLIKAAGAGRHGVRDRAMALLMYRHGLRVSELIGLRLSDFDLSSGRLTVRRLKGSQGSVQPLSGAVLRAVRAYLRERPIPSPYAQLFLSERDDPFTRFALNYLVATWGARASIPFKVHPHMLRHSCGYALVNRPGGAHDLRLIQDYLGHKDIRHTAQYTALSAGRFADLWGD